MRTAVWLLLLAVVAVVAATVLGPNDGLVSFYWSARRLDMSLNLFVVALLATCLALVLLMRAIVALLSLPQRAREWRVARRDRLAQASLREALALYFGGRYGRAQKSAQRALTIHADLPKSARDAEFSVLGHLLTAGSLHRLQDRPRRDEALARAFEIAGREHSARSAEEGARLLAAEWALDDRDAPRALELLSQLPPGVARRTHALRLRLQATRLSGQPQEALKTARLLGKHQGFSRAAALGLMRALAFEALDTARDIDQLRRLWQQLDASDRGDALIAARAATRATALGAHDEARQWLRPFWDSIGNVGAEERAALALALALSASGIGADWLPRLEAAVQRFPREAAIAFVVGVALAERQLWGKARRLLEQSAADPALAISARRRAWRMLAELSAQQGDASGAAHCYERCARLG